MGQGIENGAVEMRSGSDYPYSQVDIGGGQLSGDGAMGSHQYNMTRTISGSNPAAIPTSRSGGVAAPIVVNPNTSSNQTQPGTTVTSAMPSSQQPSQMGNGNTSSTLGPQRARALYTYTASPDDPNEVSFSKGEILEITDASGKWWQCRTVGGDSGSECILKPCQALPSFTDSTAMGHSRTVKLFGTHLKNA